MINSTCGWDSRRRLIKRGGCGKWVGYLAPAPWGYPLQPATPHFHNGVAYCGVCIKGFKVKHVGQGVFIRPKTGSDRVTLPKGPKLEELYS